MRCWEEKAEVEYRTLGRLILKGKIEEPKEPLKTDYSLADKYEKVTYLEELKTYRKLKNKQKEKK
jgi:hypothetical protein